MANLAAILQPYIDSMLTESNVNKIILVTHLQQIQLEQQLVPLLRNVDIVIAGGSSAILADSNDRLRPGDNAFGAYPIVATTADSKPCIIVSSGDEYKYLGRLVIDFNAAGEVIPSSINTAISGSYVTDSAAVIAAWGSFNAAFRPGSKASLVKTLVDAVRNVVVAKDGNIVGKTNVYLEGRRAFVRSQETNLGSLTADANIWYARQIDTTVSISLKNGGGIRSEIGEVNEVTPGVFSTLPPAPNPLANKLRGDVSRLDIENSLRFDNKLTLVTVTAGQLKRLMEHGINGWAPTATPGSFAQIGGIRLSFNPTNAAGSKIQNLLAFRATGKLDTIVLNGTLTSDSNRTYRMVTLNFLATGGDRYPFTGTTGLLSLDTVISVDGPIPYFVRGGEQDALAEYLFSFHRTTPFGVAETPAQRDSRIQNLSLRNDSVLTSVASKSIQNQVKLYPNPAKNEVRYETTLSVSAAWANTSNGRGFNYHCGTEKMLWIYPI
ncbi:MAG: Trifunctional nucleotide phosphoesterase protein YfkN [Syntrophomonadaceae bacterium]|nr:Trifunctional nucleotide phosphoesterase protein YfkN [Bacillota bacterium]